MNSNASQSTYHINKEHDVPREKTIYNRWVNNMFEAMFHV